VGASCRVPHTFTKIFRCFLGGLATLRISTHYYNILPGARARHVVCHALLHSNNTQPGAVSVMSCAIHLYTDLYFSSFGTTPRISTSPFWQQQHPTRGRAVVCHTPLHRSFFLFSHDSPRIILSAFSSDNTLPRGARARHVVCHTPLRSNNTLPEGPACVVSCAIHLYTDFFSFSAA